jgi:hypothetical protein
LYGHETSFLTVREEQRRLPHDGFTVCTLQTQENKMDKACSMHGKDRKAHKILIGKPEG